MSMSDVLASALPTGNEVQVSLATSAAPEELWAYWKDLTTVRTSASELMIALADQINQAADETLRRQLSAEHDTAWKQWKVLDAWTQVIHAAYVFLTDGDELIAFEDGTPLPF